MTICMTIILSIILALISNDLPIWTYVLVFTGSCISMFACAMFEHYYQLRIKRLEHNQDWLKNEIDKLEGRK